MLARIQKSLREKDAGFTLIELLVVMIIIGILAAIAVPVFLSQRTKAQDTATKSDVGVIGKEIATYYVDGTTVPTIALPTTGTDSGFYTITSGGTTTRIGRASTNVSINEALATGATATTWCVSLKNSQSGTKIYNYSAGRGLLEGAC